jgi:hypothetical protein
LLDPFAEGVVARAGVGEKCGAIIRVHPGGDGEGRDFGDGHAAIFLGGRSGGLRKWFKEGLCGFAHTGECPVTGVNAFG